jgi:hypothetical protein
MIKFIFMMCLSSFFCLNLLAGDNKVHQMDGVSVRSFKKADGRVYIGSTKKNLFYPLTMVLNAITNFSEKCNNKFKNKRKYTPVNIDCKYHNENLIETIVVKDIQLKNQFKDVIDTYLLGRLIFNRGTYGYYELITIREGFNKKKQKTITVSSEMLDDLEVKKFISPKFKRETAFDKTDWRFKLTQISENKTFVTYKYSTQTNHWILNKEVSVPQVFVSMSKSINDLLKSVEQGSFIQKQASMTKK